MAHPTDRKFGLLRCTHEPKNSQRGDSTGCTLPIRVFNGWFCCIHIQPNAITGVYLVLIYIHIYIYIHA